ncbi:hypothetical protein CNR22_19655 [Sphingobacteriaceae bacterium]|nr:hypothetical protein CNR22_19655 [Sphingobacteriaceae bacterium]
MVAGDGLASLILREGLYQMKPFSEAERFHLVAPPIQISNELLEDTRFLAQLWDVYGNILISQA